MGGTLQRAARSARMLFSNSKTELVAKRPPLNMAIYYQSKYTLFIYFFYK
ncbi:MAG: hypothetical protein RL329_3514 [Bacteroidota bacterium]|jgi:hypothetical protein